MQPSDAPTPPSDRGADPQAPTSGANDAPHTPGEASVAVTRSESAGRAATVGFVLGLAALFALRTQVHYFVDDAAITFRFARNWAEWGLPVFNSFELGEGATRVEGYSNALWTGLLALAGRVSGFDGLTGTADVLQVAAATMTLLVVARIALVRMGLGAVGALAAPLLVATAAPFVAWSTGGMETALFTLLLTGLFGSLLSERARVPAALFAAGVVLVRVEGLLWALGAVFAVALFARGRAKRPASAAVVSALVVFAAHTAWRKVVYGTWVPNTVLAKSGGAFGETAARGLDHLASWALVTLSPIALLVTLVPAVLHPSGGAQRAARAAFVLVLGGLAYNVAVGGDWMPFFRFLAPLAPFVALIVAAALDRLALRSGALALGTLVALCVVQPLALVDVHVAPEGLRESVYFRTFREGYSTEVARIEAARRNRDYFGTLGAGLAGSIGRGVNPGDVLAFGAIGWTGWAAPEIDFLDRNGLVTPEVAQREDVESSDGRGTAGHEKRVPHAWFLDHGEPQARFLFATFMPGAVGTPGGPPLAAAKALVRTRGVSALPAERPLFERTVLRAIPQTDGEAAGTTLMLLERATPSEAAAFWTR